MKKLILSAVAITAFGLADAQEATKSNSKPKFGVKAGMNLATITGDVEDIDPVVRFHGGVFAEFKIADKFTIQPEVIYSSQGGKSSGVEFVEGDTYSVKENLKLNYINIPVLLKYYPQPKLSFLAGPQLGILLSAKDKIEVSDGFNSASDTVDIKDSLQANDFAFMFGVGYEFTKEFFGEARYSAGISNILNSDDDKAQNGVFQISLGYRFN